jgi:hypothetical protein
MVRIITCEVVLLFHPHPNLPPSRGKELSGYKPHLTSREKELPYPEIHRPAWQERVRIAWLMCSYNERGTKSPLISLYEREKYTSKGEKLAIGKTRGPLSTKI